MKKNSPADILKMSTKYIGEGIMAVPETVLLSGQQYEELDLRLIAYNQDPEVGSPWAEVRERIRQSL